MRKVILTALVAVVALSASAGLASARSGVSVSPANTTLTLNNLTLAGAFGVDIICNVTMDAALHARTSKVLESLAGNADIAVSTGACSEGNAGLLVGGARVTGAQGPYHVRYRSFTGTLPNIASVTLRVIGVEFWVQLGSLQCLTDEPSFIDGTTTGGNPATGMRVNAANVDLRGEFLCEITQGSMTGSGSLSSAITMTLF